MWRQLKLGGKLLQCGDGYGDLLENFREPIGRMQGERGMMMIYPP